MNTPTVLSRGTERATDVAQAVGLADQARVDAAPSVGGTRFLAGGTNLVDLMKDDVERPATLIDVNRLPLHAIEARADGGGRGQRDSSRYRHPGTVVADYGGQAARVVTEGRTA